MLSIKKLSDDAAERQKNIQAVADIEAVVQMQDAWTYQALTDLLAQNSMKLMTATHPINEDILGYCLYQVVFEQAEILRIGTHPKHQRQGIASQLFAVLNKEMEANRVESLLLEVRADNAPAIALYEQQGFTVIHRRKNYYQQPHQLSIDALIMQLSYVE
ncbi:ribosomal protein S18-alanine N-acetyltransferase [Psychrobacter sp. LV10R520-6]|uniref:ribosomal protein S18-alanine N-acetyltransferase n=1 Tax=Psychrobacter sp. LV10R520-6 TaxID=1415574 RepID=UPI0024C5041E|nr:ribosomal protein S18-alanine N-acetyltransferase [Psychrobacter sp. LV10R520-6]SNT69049.1 ribosomal-protein-alanine N-acetyltransferase [Psychrobacter sp. LV10R520-6]